MMPDKGQLCYKKRFWSESLYHSLCFSYHMQPSLNTTSISYTVSCFSELTVLNLCNSSKFLQSLIFWILQILNKNFWHMAQFLVFYTWIARSSIDNIPGLCCWIHKKLSLRRYLQSIGIALLTAVSLRRWHYDIMVCVRWLVFHTYFMRAQCVHLWICEIVNEIFKNHYLQKIETLKNLALHGRTRRYTCT